MNSKTYISCELHNFVFIAIVADIKCREYIRLKRYSMITLTTGHSATVVQKKEVNKNIEMTNRNPFHLCKISTGHLFSKGDRCYIQKMSVRNASRVVFLNFSFSVKKIGENMDIYDTK